MEEKPRGWGSDVNNRAKLPSNKSPNRKPMCTIKIKEAKQDYYRGEREQKGMLLERLGASEGIEEWGVEIESGGKENAVRGARERTRRGGRGRPDDPLSY